MENKKKGIKGKLLKLFNICWKTGFILTGITCLTVMVSYYVRKHELLYGDKAHQWDWTISGNICVHHEHGWVRLYNVVTKEYTTPELKWVSEKPMKDSIGVYCAKSKLRGFYNANTGKITSEPKYLHAWVYSEGLAAAVDTNGKMGFVDKEGNWAILPELPYIHTHDYVFKHGVCCIKYDKMGLLKKDGTWAVPMEYDFIGYLEKPDVFTLYKEGKAGAVKNGTFEWVVPMEYDDIVWTETENGGAFGLYRNHSRQNVAMDGTVIDRFVIDATESLYYTQKTDSGITNIESQNVKKYRVGESWGVLDCKTGKSIIPAIYDCIKFVSGNILECNVSTGDDDIYTVLYNTRGQRIE